MNEAQRLLLQFNEADMRAQRSSGAVRSTTREERDALRTAVQVSLSRSAAAAMHTRVVGPTVAAMDGAFGGRSQWSMPGRRLAGTPQHGLRLSCWGC